MISKKNLSCIRKENIVDLAIERKWKETSLIIRVWNNF